VLTPMFNSLFVLFSLLIVGIIGMPYAMKQSGLIVGVVMLLLVAWMTDKSLRMMIDAATFHPQLHHHQIKTFEDLMSIPFGNAGRTFIFVSMFILAYGAMCAYLIIIKDTVPTVLGITDEASTGSGSFVEREVIMLVTSLVIVLPLSMMRDMASLAMTSAISVLADIILVIFVVAYSPIKSTVSSNGGFGSVLADNWINSKLFIGLGVLSTALACQHSAFIVSGSLNQLTSHRWSTVTKYSITLSALLCFLMGVCGYLGYLGNTEGDILNNFPADSFESNAGRALLAITMFCKCETQMLRWFVRYTESAVSHIFLPFIAK
jgi:solute carrier family 38 (sodium-coupled neutral amino acid transporter), member 11